MGGFEGGFYLEVRTEVRCTRQEKYTVKKGDNPTKIAREHGISEKKHIDELIKENGIKDPARLQIGKVLVVNVPEACPKEEPKEEEKAPVAVNEKPAPSVDLDHTSFVEIVEGELNKQSGVKLDTIKGQIKLGEIRTDQDFRDYMIRKLEEQRKEFNVEFLGRMSQY